MNKNIILLTSSFPYGRGEQFLETEIKYLSKAFDKVVILPMSITNSKREVPENVTVDINYAKIRKQTIWSKFKKIFCVLRSRFLYREIAINYKKLLNLYNLKLLISELGEAIKISNFLEKYIDSSALFYSYWNGTTAMALIILKMRYPTIKIIARVHKGELYEELYKYNYLPLRKIIYQNIDQIYSISQDGIVYINNKYHIPIDKIYLSRLGVQKQNFITKINDDKNIFTIVSCSNFVKEKRFDLIIDLIYKFSKKTSKKIIWYHIGSGDRFEYYKKIAYAKKTSNLDIYFKGYMDNRDVLAFYKDTQIDIFINLSSSEGIPVSIMEAQSCSIPVVATNVGGVSEIVDNENGILVDKNFNEDNLIRSLIQLSSNQDELNNKKEKSYIKWKTDFNADNNYKQFVGWIGKNI